MLREKWAKPLAKAALLVIFGAGTFCCACAQRAVGDGSLSGKLTDIHSAPLENVTVTLRNADTGSQVQTTTAHGGRYSFTGLAQGEYILTATGPRGTGQVDGIFVALGHEAHIQIALDFKADQPKVATLGDVGNASPSVNESLALRLRTLQTAQPPILSMMNPAAISVSVFLPTEPSVLIPLTAKSMPASSLPTVSGAAPITAAPSGSSSFATNALPTLKLPVIAPPAMLMSPMAVLSLPGSAADDLAHAIAAVELSVADACLRGIPIHRSAQITVLESAAVHSSPQSLDSTQLQSLPLPGRDWQSFLRDAPEQGANTGDQQNPPSSEILAPEVTVDGARTQVAFGTTTANSGHTREFTGVNPVSSDASIRELQISGEGPASIHASPGSINIHTQQGTERLHGQASIFTRQNLWGARNPFTQWVQETGPATPTAVPLFTAEPYSPSDREALWGAGLGGAIRKAHLFWFGSLGGNDRDNPAVSTVKHPDHFFAQPANDQMQLLSAQLGLSSADPVSAGVDAYSRLLENLAGLLGPAPRSSSQLTGFARIDWTPAERNHFTLDATASGLDKPGGGFSRASEAYGSHSFGVVNSASQWMLGKWDAFITPNVLSATQFSYGHHLYRTAPETPTPVEQSLNIHAWGQLPQIVVDSRYGFTIGNPARFGKGSYPDEHLYLAGEQLNWVHGNLMLKGGFEFSHNADATTRLRNQTGTYYYSSIENFASDALAFASFGLNGQLNPMDQHNCDQTGRAWRDSSGVLHGLGYLPCYSYYSQTMGPSDWWVSTNHWAGYATSQWQPTRRFTATLAIRWELEQLPSPIASVQNADLPLAGRMPGLGGQWGPRVGFAWGTGESHWPVFRSGYGIYFGQTRNSVLETALTQTGSLKGDLNFFMRPTDNLNAGGAPPFPYVFAGEPASVVKPGAVEFAPNFRNSEIQQAEASLQEAAPGHIQVEAAAIISLGRRLPVTFDANIDPLTGSNTITYAVVDGNHSGPIKSPQIIVPFFASWPSSAAPTGFAGRVNPNYQQVIEIYSRANSTYEAATLRISRSARVLTLRARYIYAHAMDWNPDETSQIGGPSVFDPIDFRQEYGTSSLDVRHSATVAVILQPRWKLSGVAGYIAKNWMLSGAGYFRSGLPYTMQTSGSLAREFTADGTAIVALSTGMNGYGGDNRVYGIGRNTYRYPSTWKADLRLSKRFELGHMGQLELIAESFNLFNHQNVTELETTGYSIASGTENGGLPQLNFLTGLKTGQTEFGKPLNINATDFYRERQIQFGARFAF